MLYLVLKHLRNFFVVDHRDNTYTINGSEITCVGSDGVQHPINFLQQGQYFLVEGSVFNDGVYQFPCERVNETFTGAISALAIPQEVVELSRDIAAWQKKYGDPTPYMSESFGGYSYTKATQGSTGTATWQEAFRNRLHTWRKI